MSKLKQLINEANEKQTYIDSKGVERYMNNKPVDKSITSSRSDLPKMNKKVVEPNPQPKSTEVPSLAKLYQTGQNVPIGAGISSAIKTALKTVGLNGIGITSGKRIGNKKYLYSLAIPDNEVHSELKSTNANHWTNRVNKALHKFNDINKNFAKVKFSEQTNSGDELLVFIEFK